MALTFKPAAPYVLATADGKYKILYSFDLQRNKMHAKLLFQDQTIEERECGNFRDERAELLESLYTIADEHKTKRSRDTLDEQCGSGEGESANG